VSELERNYECPRCGMRALVAVDGRGASAERRDADANAVLAMAACPRCYERPGGVVGKAALRIALLSIGAAVAFWMVVATLLLHRLDQLGDLWALEPVVLLATAGWLAAVELRRWRAGARLTIVRERAPAPDGLPRAVARPHRR
jgi:hypothetical protein